MVHSSPTLSVGTAGGLRRGKSGGKDDRETKKQGIHVRKHLIKEKETKAKELKRSESGENEIKVRQA